VSAVDASFERRCGYCGRAHPVSDHVAEESPFCAACLHERISKRATGRAAVEVVEVSRNAVVVRSLLPERPDSGPV
jgi:hypothetical protein